MLLSRFSSCFVLFFVSVRFLTPSCGLSHHISRPRVVVQLQRRASSGPGSWGVLPPGLGQRGPILLTHEGTLGVQMAWLCCRRLRLPCTVLASRLAPNEHLPYRILSLPPPQLPSQCKSGLSRSGTGQTHTEPDISLISFGKIQRQKEISYKKREGKPKKKDPSIAALSEAAVRRKLRWRSGGMGPRGTRGYTA